jgi:hypothetical protein
MAISHLTLNFSSSPLLSLCHLFEIGTTGQPPVYPEIAGYISSAEMLSDRFQTAAWKPVTEPWLI